MTARIHHNQKIHQTLNHRGITSKTASSSLDLGKSKATILIQIFLTTTSFLRYNLLNFLNEKENYSTMGDLSQDLAD